MRHPMLGCDAHDPVAGRVHSPAADQTVRLLGSGAKVRVSFVHARKGINPTPMGHQRDTPQAPVEPQSMPVGASAEWDTFQAQTDP